MLTSLAIDNSLADADRDFLARFYHLTDTAPWQLRLVKGLYQLSATQQGLILRLDFNAGNYRHRHRHPGKEPLLKALKIKQKLPHTVIDATPGVLKDSLMLAARGVQVIAIERHPLLFVMVRRALQGLQPPLAIDYHFGDAAQRLAEFYGQVIYLDPMYPAKKKSAQVKKDMQILQQIVGDDADADALLAAARRQNCRVVVKRPGYAEPLGGAKPDFVSQIGATRFDVYL